ncbi:carboxyltransferase domain-containing protein [Nesterenkonia sp. MY13]|uniref:Carboxyltransferase domain-containing protein n=1 Tax=Nesterenkonia sedimenti TaxID=1463632 RepID=A0A7X8YDX9_9MICC|nr:carboxyltransferase domain-containing protein [Nesterenkonia sedimenti]NLS09637.1 carboxyltransferase domain-containing protein [Nesterenkonia sedimenti]
MSESIRWMGQRALMLDLESLAEVLAYHQQLNSEPLPGQVEATPAASNLLIDFRSRRDAAAAPRRLRRIKPKPFTPAPAEPIDLEVNYTGADLHAVAEAVGMSVEALINWHSSTTWIAAYAGTRPGLVAATPEQLIGRKRLRKAEIPPMVPRKTEAAALPAGSVALADQLSTSCPMEHTADWQIIGHTNAALWDPHRSQPALLYPGDRIRYRAVTETITVSPPSCPAPPKLADTDAVIEVLNTGAQTLIQDLGRPGRRHQGLSRSGAADTPALRQANQLVGNDDAAAGFEVLYGGLELTVHQTSVLAVTGAEAPLTVHSRQPNEHRSNMALNGTGGGPSEEETGIPAAEDTREVPLRAPFWMFPGERLRLGTPATGIRNYLAISGGLAAPTALGSSATDIRSGMGPAPVAAGDRFGLLGAPSGFVGIADVAPTSLPAAQGPTTLRFIPGPHDHLFAAKNTPTGIATLQTGCWEVDTDSNRVGLRLNRPETESSPRLSPPAEIPQQAEPLVRGAIQIQPEAGPLLFLTDHPVTGGYPVLGVVVREDLGLAAQLPPGTGIRFQAVDPDTLEPISG